MIEVKSMNEKKLWIKKKKTAYHIHFNGGIDGSEKSVVLKITNYNVWCFGNILN